MEIEEFKKLQNVLSFNRLSEILSDCSSLELQLKAVKQYGYAIQYIKKPVCELQLEAVKRNGYAIQYIKKPSLELQKHCLDKYNDCYFLENGLVKEICEKNKTCIFRFENGIYEKCCFYLEHVALKK